MKKYLSTIFLAITLFGSTYTCAQTTAALAPEKVLTANWYNQSKQFIFTNLEQAQVTTKKFGSLIKHHAFDKLPEGCTKNTINFFGSSAQYGLETAWSNKTVFLIALIYIWLARTFESMNPLKWYHNYQKSIVKAGLLKHDAKQTSPLGVIADQELEAATKYYLQHPGIYFADVYTTIPAMQDLERTETTKFLQKKDIYIDAIFTSYASKVAEKLGTELTEAQKIKVEDEKNKFIKKVNKQAEAATKTVDSRNNFLSIYKSSQKTLEELNKADKSTTTTPLQQSNLFKMWVENSVTAILALTK